MVVSPQMVSPLSGAARALGARFTVLDGWQVVTAFTSPDDEAAAARSRVGLADASPAGKVTVEGLEAAGVLESVWGSAVPPVGAGLGVADGRLFRLREDLFLVWTRPGAEGEVLDKLQGASRGSQALVTVTDTTHGRAALRLAGPGSAEVLSRLCGLDFSPAAFPDLAIRASSVAKTPGWLLRDDLGELPSFVVVGARSLGAYLWEVIHEAGQDLGIQPLGQEALEALNGGSPAQSAGAPAV